MATFEKLLSVSRRRGGGFLPYIDPDRLDKSDLAHTAATCEQNGADAILIGGSFLLSTHFDRMVREVKGAVQIPVVIFPGDTSQISAAADAILFLSLISGRNPELLIGQHVKAAPLLKAHGLEPIATAVGEEAGTIEEVYEPFLIKEGYIKRTPRGREATRLAYQHLGKYREDQNFLF